AWKTVPPADKRPRCGRRRPRRRRPRSLRITSVTRPGARDGTAPASSSARSVTTSAWRGEPDGGWPGNYRCGAPCRCRPRRRGTGPGLRAPLRMRWGRAPVTAEACHGPDCPLSLAWTAQCCTSHLGNGRRPLSRGKPREAKTPTLLGRPFCARPSQQSLGLTLTPGRVTHIKCYHCYLKILSMLEDATGAKWALRAYESYRPGTRALPNV